MTIRGRVSTEGRHRRWGGGGGGRRPARRRGFSLLELLAVLLILGLTFVIASVEGLKAIQRQRLASASSDLTILMSRAASEMQTRGVSIFVVLDGAARQIQLVADTNQNNAPDAAPTDRVLQTLTLPSDVVFSTADVSQVQSAFWSFNLPTASTARWIGCDLRMRTFATAGGGQIGGVATLSLTHMQMVGSSPTLRPPVLFQVRVSQVWNVQANRSLY